MWPPPSSLVTQLGCLWWRRTLFTRWIRCLPLPLPPCLALGIHSSDICKENTEGELCHPTCLPHLFQIQEMTVFHMSGWSDDLWQTPSSTTSSFFCYRSWLCHSLLRSLEINLLPSTSSRSNLTRVPPTSFVTATRSQDVLIPNPTTTIPALVDQEQFPMVFKMQPKCLHLVLSWEGWLSVLCKWVIHVTSCGLIAAEPFFPTQYHFNYSIERRVCVTVKKEHI